MNGTEEDILFDHNIGSNDKMSDFLDSESSEDFLGFEPNNITVPPIFLNLRYCLILMF